MPPTVGPARVLRLPDPAALCRSVACEVRACCARLGADGWRLTDIATAIGCGDRSLASWRSGEKTCPAWALVALRRLAGDVPEKEAA